MSIFRPGYKPIPEGAAQQGLTRNTYVMAPTAGAVDYIDNRLSDGCVTSFRIIPSVSEQGYDLPLNPAASPEMGFADKIGPVLRLQEVCKEVGGRDLNTFLSGCRVGGDGEYVNDQWSAARIILNRLQYKVSEHKAFSAAGIKSDAPSSWASWRMKYPCHAPMDWVFCQCMVWEHNGKPYTDLQTNARVMHGPSVFAIPASARDGFIESITQRVDAEQPLSLTNNYFGDFCSEEGGCKLLLRKLVTQGTGGAKKTDYNVVRMEPSPMPPNCAATLWQPWETLLNTPATIEEELAMLAKVFDWAAVDYALRADNGSNYYRYIPDEHKECSSNMADAVSKQELEALAGSARGQGTASAPVQGASYPARSQQAYPQSQGFHQQRPQAQAQQAYPQPQAQAQQAYPQPQAQAQQAYPQPQAQAQQAQAQAQQAYPQPQAQAQQAQQAQQASGVEQSSPEGFLPKAPSPQRQAPPHSEEEPQQAKEPAPENHQAQNQPGVTANPESQDIFAEALANMQKLRGIK